jgi:hypothetical protein
MDLNAGLDVIIVYATNQQQRSNCEEDLSPAFLLFHSIFTRAA